MSSRSRCSPEMMPWLIEWPQPKGLPKAVDPFPGLDVAARAQTQEGQLSARVDFDQRDVAALIAADEFSPRIALYRALRSAL